MKAIGFLVAVGVISAAPAAHAGSEQFDLVCRGQEQRALSAPKLEYTDRYVIDLAAMKWCDQYHCGSIQDANPGQITFTDKKSDTGARGMVLHYVSRSTGRFVDFYSDRDVYWSREGTCEPAPFSGFPATKF